MFLNKFLPYFFFPLTWSLLLLVLAIWMLQRQRTGAAMLSILLAIGCLWIFSTARVSQVLMESLENQSPPRVASEVPAADAIILLGGAMLHPVPPRPQAEMNDAGDRVTFAAALYHAGKAPYIIISGGQVFPQDGLLTEADYHIELFEALGVPRDHLILETQARNTSENASYIAALGEEKGFQKMILVTSAFHMPRSLYLFEPFDLDLIAAPTDYRAPVHGQPEVLLWLPDADALADSQLALREWMGIAFYRLRDTLGG